MSDAHDTTLEVWKPVPFPPYCSLYSVSTLGNVRAETACPRNGQKAGRILRSHVNSHGYPLVLLSAGPKRYTINVHRLVMHAFSTPPGVTGRKSGEWQIDHLNGDKTDNRLCNLQWIDSVTHHHESHARGQMMHGTSAPKNPARGERSGPRLHPERMLRGGAHHNTHLTEADVKEIRLRRSEGISFTALGVRYKISGTNVARICKRTTWQHVD